MIALWTVPEEAIPEEIAAIIAPIFPQEIRAERFFRQQHLQSQKAIYEADSEMKNHLSL